MPATDRPRAFDLAASLLGLLVLAGVYLDGWAHNHDKVDESFFTPWHAVLYLSIFLAGAFFAATAARNRRRGVPRREVLPPGYLLSLGGVALFMAGGLADLVWHLLFGIEEDTEALLSPTHLVLAFAAVLIVSGPWRSALRAFGAGARLGWPSSIPLLLSLASVIALLAFMTQFSHPLTDTLATREERRPPALPDVYVMNADGSGQTRLTLDPDLWDAFASWSPDGKKLVVASGNPPAPSDLYVLNADGTGRSLLTHTERGDNSPSWSPDGARIAFVSNLGPDDDSGAQIFVVNADGSGTRALTNAPGRKWGTTWSPDSKRIAFSWNRDGVWQIYSLNADGSDQRRLTSGPRHSLAPAWSPDGRTIAFHRDAGKERSLIHLMDADGDNLRALAGTGRDFHPTWSPAGNELAFASFAGRKGDIYVADLAGASARNLTRSAGQGFDLASWSPDGSRIAFTAWVDQGGQNRELMRRLGVSSILLQSAILVGPLLLAVRRWGLPFGSITLVVLLTSVAAAVLKDEYELLPGALIAGVISDLLLRRFGDSHRVSGLRLFAFGLPAAFYAFYFATLTLEEGVDWSVHLWAGSIAMAGIAGLGLSYLVWPPGETASRE